MLNSKKRRGFSFGNDKKRGSFEDDFDIENPGPGKYDQVFNNYSKISFSFRSKYEDPLAKHKNVDINLFSISAQGNITILHLSTKLAIISILNIEVLDAQKLENHQGLMTRELYHQVQENTLID